MCDQKHLSRHILIDCVHFCVERVEVVALREGQILPSILGSFSRDIARETARQGVTAEIGHFVTERAGILTWIELGGTRRTVRGRITGATLGF